MAATTEEQKAFVDKVGPIVQKYAQANGWHMPSVIIAMACTECGWGKSDVAVNQNNILSLGCWPGHTGKSYGSYEECVQDFFVSSSFGRSQDARNATTMDAMITAYHDSGYSGGSLEDDKKRFEESISPTVKEWNLTGYDTGGTVPGGTSSTGATSGTSSQSSEGSTLGGTSSNAFTTAPEERETARVEEGGHPELKTFYRVNMTAAQFIKQVLAPYCRAEKTGQGGYRLWFSDEASPDGGDGTKLFFKPDQYSVMDNRVSGKLLEGIDKEYEFSFGSGIDSSVLDFNPDYTGLVISLMGGAKVEAETTNAITNELMSAFYDRYSDEKRPSTGDSVYDDLDGTFRIGDSSYTPEEMANKAANLWYNMASYGYRADMTIIGDPLIKPQTLCSIAVFTPQGLPHNSSGVYLIYQVVDSIEGGTFTTELSLVRNAIQIGVNDSGGLDITIGPDTNFVGEAANALGMNTGTGNSAASGLDSSSSSGGLNAQLGQGQTINIPDGLGTYYTITGYGPGGWVYTSGKTSAIAAGTNQRTVHDKWVAAGSKYTDHIATLDGRYLIACTSTYGKVGDYITFTLANGQQIDSIMADEKNPNDPGCNEWGHDNGACVIEFEVDMSYYKQMGNPGSSKWKSEWSGTSVTSATNYGSAI